MELSHSFKRDQLLRTEEAKKLCWLLVYLWQKRMLVPDTNGKVRILSSKLFMRCSEHYAWTTARYNRAINDMGLNESGVIIAGEFVEAERLGLPLVELIVDYGCLEKLMELRDLDELVMNEQLRLIENY